MTLEVKNLSDLLASSFSWVFYRPELMPIGKISFSLKILILYTVRKLIKNRANFNKRFGSEN